MEEFWTKLLSPVVLMLSEVDQLNEDGILLPKGIFKARGNQDWKLLWWTDVSHNTLIWLRLQWIDFIGRS